MARIRTVKPEFFTHPEVVELSIPARLLNLALFNQADDEGRLYDQPTKILGQSFGETDRVKIGSLLAELYDHDRICRYTAAGRACIHVRNFNRHQRVSHPTASVIPACELHADSGEIPESLPNDSGAAPERLRTPSGGEGKGREQGTGNGTGRGRDHPRFADFWSAWPGGKVERIAASKAFTKAATTASPDDIIAGAVRYASDPRFLAGFTKHPATWLNKGCWTDEPAASNGHKAVDSLDDRIARGRAEMGTG